MRKDKKILIDSVLKHLVERDPVWAQENMQLKLKVLYQGWAAKCIRHHIHSPEYFSRKWSDGWLPFEEYREFFNYAME